MRRSDMLFRGLTIGNSLLLLAVFVAFRAGWLQIAEIPSHEERSPLPLAMIGDQVFGS